VELGGISFTTSCEAAYVPKAGVAKLFQQVRRDHRHGGDYYLVRQTELEIDVWWFSGNRTYHLNSERNMKRYHGPQ
jgi:hypothetical protein